MHSKRKLPGESHSLVATGSVKVPPPLPPTLLPPALLPPKLVFKPGGVKVRFTALIRESLNNTKAATFGYLVAVAGVAPSLGRDATKIVEINAAILTVFCTRLLAATLVNIGLFHAHPELSQVGEGGQLLWLTLRAGTVGRVRLYEVVPLWIFVRLMRLAINDSLDIRGTDHFVGNGGLFVTFQGRASKTVHKLGKIG